MNNSFDIFSGIYAGKTVLVTGHTGFKGSWLSCWLIELGAKVIGYSLNPKHSDDIFLVSHLGEKMVDIRGDINDYQHLEEVILTHQPDFIFHLAAQPLVKPSYSEPKYTFETNVIGTLNVLEVLRKVEKKVAVVLITTDKVYENKEQGHAFKESDSLGGYDPYSASKAAAEIVISSYRSSFFNVEHSTKHQKYIAAARAGNVIGGGDWSEFRLVPDAIKALKADEVLIIRAPEAIRPWQHVIEPLAGYLKLGEKLYSEGNKYASAYNFGPDVKSFINVETIVKEIIKVFNKGKYRIEKNNIHHEASILMLDSTKAAVELGFKNVYDYKDAIQKTIDWYRDYKKVDAYTLTKKQILNYLEVRK